MDLFYAENIYDSKVVLHEEQHRHCIKSMRKKIGDEIYLTDGKGKLMKAMLKEVARNESTFEILTIEEQDGLVPHITIGIAPTKNMSRFEWFLEKAVELGVHRIVPFVSQNSERKHLKLDRCIKIMVSAMKQSLRCWLPEISEIQKLKDTHWDGMANSRFICYVPHKEAYLGTRYKVNQNTLIMIGPEGGFTLEEVKGLEDKGFEAVSLGQTRLRTETAGIAALQIIHTLNNI